MRGLDLFLRGKIFGPIAWAVERRFGYSKFAIARLCIYASGIGGVGYFALTNMAHVYGVVVSLVALLPWFLMAWLQLERFKRDEILAEVRPDVHLVIEDKVWPLRLLQLVVFFDFDLLVLALIIGSELGWLWLMIVPCRFYMTLFACGTYFASVPSPPPYKKKERAPLFGWLFPVPHGA